MHPILNNTKKTWLEMLNPRNMAFIFIIHLCFICLESYCKITEVNKIRVNFTWQIKNDFQKKKWLFLCSAKLFKVQHENGNRFWILYTKIFRWFKPIAVWKLRKYVHVNFTWSKIVCVFFLERRSLLFKPCIR